MHLIVTDMAVIEVTPEGLVLKERAEDTTVDAIRAATGATLIVGDGGSVLMAVVIALGLPHGDRFVRRHAGTVHARRSLARSS